jgi:uncharacterized damage-inducible protein DinB
MNPKSVHTLYSYNYWAFERVWNCITQLTDDQFTQPVDYSTGPIRNQVVHMMSATHRWMLRMQRAPMPARLKFDDFMTRAVTKAKWDELRSETMDYVTSLTQDQLDETIRWELPDRGIVAENPRWELLLHAANHGTDHRAQVLTILNQHFKIQTVEQDMILFLTEPPGKLV